MIEWASSFKHGIRFKCLGCASCCKHIRYGVGLTDRDYMRIRDVLHRGNFAESGSHLVFTFSLNSIRGRCVFLDGKSCSIYGARPLLYRLYPAQVGIKHDGKLLICLNHCPGVDQHACMLLKLGYYTTLGVFFRPAPRAELALSDCASSLNLSGRCFITQRELMPVSSAILYAIFLGSIPSFW